jgi:GNAT superfamily N-acetyltransferase
LIRVRFTKPQFAISSESLRLYAFKLSEGTPQIRPKVIVKVTTHDRPLELGSLQRSIVEQRIAQGDKICVARHSSNPVAYIFIATRNCWVDEIQDWFIVASGEVYLYDAFTSDEYRRNRIYSFLLSHATRLFKESAFSYVLIFSTALNTSSIKGIERAGFQCYEIVYFYNIFGFKIWNYKKQHNGIESRFSNEI